MLSQFDFFKFCHNFEKKKIKIQKIRKKICDRIFFVTTLTIVTIVTTVTTVTTGKLGEKIIPDNMFKYGTSSARHFFIRRTIRSSSVWNRSSLKQEDLKFWSRSCTNICRTTYLSSIPSRL